MTQEVLCCLASPTFLSPSPALLLCPRLLSIYTCFFQIDLLLPVWGKNCICSLFCATLFSQPLHGWVSLMFQKPAERPPPQEGDPPAIYREEPCSSTLTDGSPLRHPFCFPHDILYLCCSCARLLFISLLLKYKIQERMDLECFIALSLGPRSV